MFAPSCPPDVPFCLECDPPICNCLQSQLLKHTLPSCLLCLLFFSAYIASSALVTEEEDTIYDRELHLHMVINRL